MDVRNRWSTYDKQQCLYTSQKEIGTTDSDKDSCIETEITSTRTQETTHTVKDKSQSDDSIGYQILS